MFQAVRVTELPEVTEVLAGLFDQEPGAEELGRCTARQTGDRTPRQKRRREVRGPNILKIKTIANSISTSMCA